MTKNLKLKRGTVVRLVYKNQTTENTVYGIVLEVNTRAIIIGHNFNNTTLVDKSRIPLQSVVNAQSVTPQEYPNF